MITRPVKHEFERQLLNGEITDIEPYFADRRYMAERYILAKHGINVDQTLRMDGRMRWNDGKENAEMF